MLMTGFDTSCGRCKKGTLILVGRAGRVVRSGGADVAVPGNFMIPTCDHCGAERFDAAMAKALDAALTQARLIALRSADTVEMDVRVDERPALQTSVPYLARPAATRTS